MNAPRALRVLVADDREELVDVLAEVFLQAGCEVARAHDGIAALETIATFQPDAALVDISMPGMSGYDVAKAARRHRGTSLLLLAVTANVSAEDVERAYAAGFDYHFGKPVDPAHLLNLVTRVCRARIQHDTQVAQSHQLEATASTIRTNPTKT